MKYELAMKWLDRIWANQQGWAHVAHKPGPEAAGRGGFTTTAFRWPSDRRGVWAWMKQHGSTAGLFYVPAINKTETLRAEDAVSYRWIWAESDRPTPRVLTEWPCWRTLSGRPGHHHVMQELSESIGWEEWDAAQAALTDFLGTEQKQSATRFLRIPGSVNRKELLGADGRPVRLIKPAGQVMPVEALRTAVRDHGSADTRRPVTVAQHRREAPSRLVTARLDDDSFGANHRGIYMVARDLLIKHRWTVDETVELIDGSVLHGEKIASDPAYNLERDVAGIARKAGLTHG